MVIHNPRLTALYRLIRTAGLAWLALCVALAAPAEAAAWLHGGHVTLEQEALHEYADELGIVHHHGGSDEHPDDVPVSVGVSLVAHGPELTPASESNLVPNDTLQTVVTRFALAVPPGVLPRIVGFLKLAFTPIYLPLPKLPPQLAPDLTWASQ